MSIFSESYNWILSRAELWIDIGIALGIFLFFLVLRKVFTRYVFRLLLKWVQKTNTELFEYALKAFERPLRMFFLLLGLFVATQYLPLSAEINVLISKIFSSAVIILVAWGFFLLSDSSSTWIEKLMEKYKLTFDRLLIPFFSKMIRTVVVVVAVSIVMGTWGYNINSLVAGLGLGGLAFALAAKDSLSNIFGGVVIITERSFSKGDWIETPSVEGTVEEITFRSTRVRTFAQALVTIPNSTLANEPITNWSRMGKRRINFYLGVTYSTPGDKLEIAVNRIREMLKNHPEIHPETILVYFDRFNTSSLDIFLYFFTKTTNWNEWLRVKQDCNLKIMQILEEEGVGIAFPSRNIYIETKSDLLKKEGNQPG